MEEVIQQLLSHSYTTVLTHHGPNPSVLATRAALEALRYYNIEAKPFATKVKVFNQKFVEAIEAEHPSPKDVPGAFGLSIGFNALVNWWQGHLVATLEGHILDIAIAKYTETQKGLNLEPVCVPAPDELFSGQQAGYTDEHGMMVVYGAYLGETGYRETEQWKSERIWRPVAAELINAMKGA